MIRNTVIFAVCLIIWLMVVWPFELVAGELDIKWLYLLAGVAAAAIAVAVTREPRAEKPLRFLLTPLACAWAVIYIVVLVYYIIKANFDVAYRVLHPAMPLRPGIVKVKTGLRSSAAITVLANSITLTPGTLTVSADHQGVLYVHWINITSKRPEVETQEIVGRFEWFIKRIFRGEMQS
jgi:multicomponent Na+:H+ antiporter subunit E